MLHERCCWQQLLDVTAASLKSVGCRLEPPPPPQHLPPPIIGIASYGSYSHSPPPPLSLFSRSPLLCLFLFGPWHTRLHPVQPGTKSSLRLITETLIRTKEQKFTGTSLYQQKFIGQS